jgi:hypothetical protein
LLRNRIAALLAALAIPLFAVLGLATPAAAAYELNFAQDVDWYADSSRECYSNTWVSACIQKNGDDIWIKDNVDDDYAVQVTWWDTDGTREGYCVDNLGYSKAWTRCNKDWTDGHQINWYVEYHTAGDWWPGPTQTTVV